MSKYLLSNLPEGVVSKNDIGALRTASSGFPWIIVDALRDPMNIEAISPPRANTEIKIKPMISDYAKMILLLVFHQNKSLINIL